MEVIRDQLWQDCLASAVKMHRLMEPNEQCIKLADATWKCKMAYKKAEAKKEERQVIVIDKAPEVRGVQRSQNKICMANFPLFQKEPAQLFQIVALVRSFL